jgi:hypothetical protein
MARLPKSERDALKDQGLWRFGKKSKYEVGAELFAAGAAEANEIRFRPEFHDGEHCFNFAHSPDVFADAWCEVIESDDSDPFNNGVQDGLGFDPSFLPAQSFLLGSALRVLKSSHSEVLLNSGSFPTFPVPKNQLPFLMSLGEFDRGDVSFRFSSAHAEVKSFLRSAAEITSSVSAYESLLRSWLPVSSDDERYKFLVAESLERWFHTRGHHGSVRNALQRYIASDVIPDFAASLAQTLDNEVRQEFLKLFHSFKTQESFFRLFGKPRALAFLSGIGLPWKDPRPEHLMLNKSVPELINMIKTILPSEYLDYVGPGVVSSASLVGPGSSCQTISFSADKEVFYVPHGTSVEAVVSASVFRSSAVFGRDLVLEPVQLPFSPFQEFRGPDVDWFDPGSLKFSFDVM